MKQLFARSFESLKRAYARTFLKPASKRHRSISVFPVSAGNLFFLLLLFAAIALLVIKVDAPLVSFIRRLDRESPVAVFFEALTHLGTSGWILVISGVIGIVLSMRHWNAAETGQWGVRKNFAIYADANFLFFTVAVSGIAANLIKNTIGRARPKHFEDLGHLHFEFAAFEPGFASFPSGHSTTFGALFMALALLYPRFWSIFAVAGILGGVSRVMVGAHYASDVLAGLAFGAIFVVIAARYLAKRGLMFRLANSPIPRRHR